MKKSVLLICLLFFMSCGLNNKYEENLSTMASIVKKEIEDAMFKENITIEFLEFNPIKYDTVPRSTYDEFLKDAYLKELDRHSDRVKLNSLKIKKEFSSYELSELSQSRTGMVLAKSELEKLRRLQDEELKIADEIFNKINEIDSLANLKDSTEVVYQLKLFMKAVITNNSDGEKANLLDTVYYLFDTNLGFMKLPDVSVDFAE